MVAQIKISSSWENKNESDEKPNIWQMKKKERKDFRRQQDENYDLVHDLKKLYETISLLKATILLLNILAEVPGPPSWLPKLINQSVNY